MNARQRRRAHYLRSLSAPASRDAAVAQAVDQYLADLGPNVAITRDPDGQIVWLEKVGDQWAEAARYPDLDAFARAHAIEIPAVSGGRNTR